MPKWSEVPWVTVITGVIAIYGAVLSTVNSVSQRRRDHLATQRQLRQDQLVMEEARRRQADQVTGWLVEDDGPKEFNRLFYGLMLQNGSSQPVRQLIASVVGTQGSFRRTAVGADYVEEPSEIAITGGIHRHQYRLFVGLLPPGETKTRIEQPGQGTHRRYGVELAFQDAAGCNWRRQGDGILKQVDEHPLDLYGINPPVPWQHT
jgi:hypothetical protein